MIHKYRYIERLFPAVRARMISEVVNSLLQIFANASAGECIAVSTSVLYRAVCSNTRNQGSK